MKEECQYLSVAGYGWSGSGALMDLLREFDTIGEFDMELRILRDPNGVIDLEYQMVERWDALNVDIAIKEFLSLAKKMARKRTKFKIGGELDELFDGQFYQCAVDFVGEITRFRYNSYWWFLDFRASYFRWLSQRIARRINHKSYGEEAYFGKIDRDEFHKAVQSYMDALVRVFNADKKYDYFIIEQAFSPSYPQKAFDYCRGTKVIVVDRDPRDIYVELIKNRKIIGYDLEDSHDAMKYVEWHKAYRVSIESDNSNILYLKFEDLVYHYDEVLVEILEFIQVDGVELNHVRKMQLFNPQISEKNIGQHKIYKHQSEIKIIEKELGKYLYVHS
ncbi:MAG: hypothetical protein R3Y54_05895 [Eubacteriales bacterium]